MAGYWFPHDQKKNELFISSAVKAQEKVGALGASLKTNPNNKPQPIMSGSIGKGSIDKGELSDVLGNLFPPKEDNTTPKPGSIVKNNQSGALELKIDSESNNPAESWKGKKWSDMTGAEKFQGGAAVASSILDTLDTLTGGKDQMLPGSGHTYSSGYNPDMYIGQGPGY